MSKMERVGDVAAEEEVNVNPERPVIIGREKKLERDEIIFIIGMLIVPVVQFLIFWVGVNLNSFLMAFQKYPTNDWSLYNFEVVFEELSRADADLSIAIRNTLIFFVKDLLLIPFQLVISYVLYKQVLGAKIFRIIFYLPTVISAVVITTAFSNMIMPPDGPLAVLLSSMGMKEVPEFLANSDYALGTVMVFTIWMGWAGNMLLFGGALARIPVELLESARLEGITTGKEIIHMILPLVWPTMSTMIILKMTTIFGAGGPILLLTQGTYKTWTIGYWIFSKVAVGYGGGVSSHGICSAAGMIFTVIGVPLIMGARWLVEKIPVVEY